MAQVESIGSPGWAPRSDERTYLNYPEAVSDANIGEFLGEVQDVCFGSRAPENVATADEPRTRAVARAVAERGLVAETLRDKELFGLTEAVVPLPTGEVLWYLARNLDERTPSEAEHEALRATVRQANQEEPLADITPPEDYRLTRTVEDAEQLAALWKPFGWEKDGVATFQARIADEADKPATERNAWYTGLMDETGRLIASSMAERLDMPSRIGTVALVESTEWSVDPGERRKRHGERVVGHQTRLIQTDLIDVPHRQFAEVNIIAGAVKMARRAGLVIPVFSTEHGVVEQLLYNNVRVADGYQPQDAYRSFALAIAP